MRVRHVIGLLKIAQKIWLWVIEWLCNATQHIEYTGQQNRLQWQIMNNEFAFKTTLGVKYSYRISFSISESHSMEWSIPVCDHSECWRCGSRRRLQWYWVNSHRLCFAVVVAVFAPSNTSPVIALGAAYNYTVRAVSLNKCLGVLYSRQNNGPDSSNTRRYH